jgi:putative transposase
MGRPHRFDEPGYAQHVVQRGNGRRDIFLAPEDRADYLARVHYALRRFGGALHAYVLMSNHVHLLVTPAERGGVGRLMHSLSGNYARGFNRRHERSGTLWEGRYRSATIDSETYFFACSRYIELNPVRAGLAAHPAHYHWSSFAANALGRHDRLLTPHWLYLSLGEDDVARRQRYAGMFATQPEAETVHALRTATEHAWPLGDDSFLAALARHSGRRTRPLRRRAASAPT